ncbi:MAG: hypothetical protein IJB10_04215 [Clostridia bacterium]|nr:hypothetical protein [Clostridia bacterium]
MKWYSYLICAVLIVAGIFSFISLQDIWSQSSSVVGTPITIETQNNYELVCKFDYGTVAFETEDYVEYVNTSAFAHYEFDGSKNDYNVLVNDNLLSDIKVSAGQIEAKCLINFYSTDGNLTSTADLDITIFFYDDSTQVVISMTNENDSYAYLSKYMANNGFILKVVKGSK